MSKIRIVTTPAPSSIKDNIQCTIYFDDPEMIGCKAEYTVETLVVVKREDGSNEKIIHLKKKFIIESPQIQFDISADMLVNLNYQGVKIDIINQVSIIVDDKLFSISEQTKTICNHGANKINSIQNDQSLLYTEIERNTFKSIRMLPNKIQKQLLKTTLMTCTVILIFLFFGIHDFWVGIEKSYIYTNDFFHYPLIIILTAMSLIFGALVINEALKDCLSDWITAKVNKKYIPRYFNKKSYCLISDLVKGKTTMDIDKITIRIIVCNLEHGMYSTTETDSDGKQRSVVACFDSPVNEFILYEKTIYNIIKGVNLNNHLDDKIYFKNIYENLYPKNMVSTEYGIDYFWEVQFIHDNFNDYYVQLPNNRFDDNYF